MRSLTKWFMLIVGISGAAALLVWAFRAGRVELNSEAARDAPIKPPTRVLTTPQGETVVRLTPEVQQSAGITTVPLQPATFQPRIVAYGELQVDPSRRYTIRASSAGVLRETETNGWPTVGATLTEGEVPGFIQPLLNPLERVTWSTQLATARAQLEEHRARLIAARASLGRKKTLNAEGGVVSVSAVEQAEALVHAEEAQVESATRDVELIEETLSPTCSPARGMELVLPQGGEVVEVLARPGEIVQPGQALATIARFNELLARVELPAGEFLQEPPPTARLVVLGDEDHAWRGELRASVAADPNTRGQAFIYAVPAERVPLRPGAAVTAYLDSGKDPLHGVIVPHRAVLRSEGRAWAFVQSDAEHCVRRAVDVSRPVESGWFVASGFSAGERVAVGGAQLLLSEVQKSQIRIGEEQR